MTANLQTNQKVLDYVKRSGALIAAAEKRAAAWAQKEAAVAALIPDVVEALIANNKIDERLREKAAKHLADPVSALELLASVAAFKRPEELGHLGRADGQQKSASAKTNSPYVGAIIPEEERASGRALVEAILGNR